MKGARGLKNKAEVADKVSLAAVKYSILKSGLDKDIAFDLKESVSFSGSSGPYLQYTGARINSIIKKAKKQESKKTKELMLEDAKEQAIIMKLAKYPEIVEQAGKNYAPSELAKYLFELAQEFNDYYHAVPVLKTKVDVRQARLALISAVRQTLENGLKLLGIEVMEEM